MHAGVDGRAGMYGTGQGAAGLTLGAGAAPTLRRGISLPNESRPTVGVKGIEREAEAIARSKAPGK